MPPIEQPESQRGDFAETASLKNFKGIVSGPAHNATNDIASALRELESIRPSNGSAEIRKCYLETSNTVNSGLARERSLIPLYYCLSVIGIAALFLAAAALIYTSNRWAVKVGLGGSSAALGGVEFKILDLIMKSRNQISADHHKHAETTLRAKNFQDDIDSRGHALRVYVLMSKINPGATDTTSELIKYLYPQNK